MTLSHKEETVMKQTRLRNLKRRYSKMTQHADLTDEALSLKKDIKALEMELKSFENRIQ